MPSGNKLTARLSPISAWGEPAHARQRLDPDSSVNLPNYA